MLEIIFQFSIFRFEIPISCIAVCFVALIPPRPLFFPVFLFTFLLLFLFFFSYFMVFFPLVRIFRTACSLAYAIGRLLDIFPHTAGSHQSRSFSLCVRFFTLDSPLSPPGFCCCFLAFNTVECLAQMFGRNR